MLAARSSVCTSTLSATDKCQGQDLRKARSPGAALVRMSNITYVDSRLRCTVPTSKIDIKVSETESRARRYQQRLTIRVRKIHAPNIGGLHQGLGKCKQRHDDRTCRDAQHAPRDARTQP